MLSREMEAALRGDDDFKPIWMGYFERSGDPLYAWSGEHDLVYDGHTWRGTGPLLGMGTVDKGDALAYREQEFSIAGLPPSPLADLDEDVEGRTARLWMGMLTRDAQVVRSPLLIHVMKQNFLRRRIQDDGLVTLTLSCTIALPRFDQPSGRKWSHEAQQVRFPGDEGNYYLAPAAAAGMSGLDWRPS